MIVESIKLQIWNYIELFILSLPNHVWYLRKYNKQKFYDMHDTTLWHLCHHLKCSLLFLCQLLASTLQHRVSHTGPATACPMFSQIYLHSYVGSMPLKKFINCGNCIKYSLCLSNMSLCGMRSTWTWVWKYVYWANWNNFDSAYRVQW